MERKLHGAMTDGAFRALFLEKGSALFETQRPYDVMVRPAGRHEGLGYSPVPLSEGGTSPRADITVHRLYHPDPDRIAIDISAPFETEDFVESFLRKYFFDIMRFPDAHKIEADDYDKKSPEPRLTVSVAKDPCNRKITEEEFRAVFLSQYDTAIKYLKAIDSPEFLEMTEAMKRGVASGLDRILLGIDNTIDVGVLKR